MSFGLTWGGGARDSQIDPDRDAGNAVKTIVGLNI